MSDLEQRMLGITKSMFNRLLVRVDEARVRQSSERNDLALAGRHPSELVGWTVECEDEVRATLSAYRSALAGETEQETMEKAVEAALDCDGPRLCGDDCVECREERALVEAALEAAAPIFRAPLLLQLQDKNERIKALEAKVQEQSDALSRLYAEGKR